MSDAPTRAAPMLGASSTDSDPASPRALREVVCLVALLAVVAYRSTGYAEFVDLHWADEFGYLTSGKRFFETGQPPSVAWAPFYASVLAAVDALLPPDVFVFDVMFVACRCLVAAATYWAVRPMAHPILAATTGLWILLSDRLSCDTSPGLLAVGNVYSMGLALFACVWGCLLRGRLVAAAAWSVALVMVRGEYAVWVLAMAIGVLTLRVRVPRWSNAMWIAMGALLVAIATLPADARARSWLAFRQHYGGHAMTVRLREAYGETPRLTDAEALQAVYAIEKAAELPDEVIREDFGPVTGTAQALLANPGRFLGFVGSNLRGGPYMLNRSLAPNWSQSAWIVLAIWVATVGGVAFAARCAWRGSWRHGTALAAGFAALPAAAAATSLTMPRFELLFSVTFAALFFAAVGMERARVALGLSCRESRCAIAVVVWFAVLQCAVLPRHFARRGEEPLPVRDSLTALLRAKPAENSKVLTSEWMVLPVDALHELGRLPRLEVSTLRNLRFLAPANGGASLVERGIEAVVWDRRLEFESTMAPGLKAQLDLPPWRRASSVGGTVLYLRE